MELTTHIPCLGRVGTVYIYIDGTDRTHSLSRSCGDCIYILMELTARIPCLGRVGTVYIYIYIYIALHSACCSLC